MAAGLAPRPAGTLFCGSAGPRKIGTGIAVGPALAGALYATAKLTWPYRAACST